MEIKANYVKKLKQGDFENKVYTLLHSNSVDNELMTLTKANFKDDKYIPQCKFNDLNTYEGKFELDELSYTVLYSNVSDVSDPSIDTSALVEVSSNLERSQVTSMDLDKDVDEVQFISESGDVSSYDIDDKCVKFNKLFTVISTGVDKFNLIKSIHETSMHPHEALGRDISTCQYNEPLIKSEGTVKIDFRNNTVLGFNTTNRTILK